MKKIITIGWFIFVFLIASCNIVESYKLTLPSEVTSNVSDLNNVKRGTRISLTINIPSGKELDYLKVNDEVVTVSGNKYTFNITLDTVVEVKFKDIEEIEDVFYSLSLPDYVQANVSSLTEILKNTEVTLDFNYPSDLELEWVKLNGEIITLTNNKYTFIITENSVITLKFLDETWTDLTNNEKEVLLNSINYDFYRPNETYEIILNNNLNSENKNIIFNYDEKDLINEFNMEVLVDDEIATYYYTNGFRYLNYRDVKIKERQNLTTNTFNDIFDDEIIPFEMNYLNDTLSVIFQTYHTLLVDNEKVIFSKNKNTYKLTLSLTNESFLEVFSNIHTLGINNLINLVENNELIINISFEMIIIDDNIDEISLELYFSEPLSSKLNVVKYQFNKTNDEIIPLTNLENYLLEDYQSQYIMIYDNDDLLFADYLSDEDLLNINDYIYKKDHYINKIYLDKTLTNELDFNNFPLDDLNVYVKWEKYQSLSDILNNIDLNLYALINEDLGFIYVKIDNYILIQTDRKIYLIDLINNKHYISDTYEDIITYEIDDPAFMLNNFHEYLINLNEDSFISLKNMFLNEDIIIDKITKKVYLGMIGYGLKDNAYYDLYGHEFLDEHAGNLLNIIDEILNNIEIDEVYYPEIDNKKYYNFNDLENDFEIRIHFKSGIYKDVKLKDIPDYGYIYDIDDETQTLKINGNQIPLKYYDSTRGSAIVVKVSESTSELYYVNELTKLPVSDTDYLVKRISLKSNNQLFHDLEGLKNYALNKPITYYEIYYEYYEFSELVNKLKNDNKSIIFTYMYDLKLRYYINQNQFVLDDIIITIKEDNIEIIWEDICYQIPNYLVDSEFISEMIDRKDHEIDFSFIMMLYHAFSNDLEVIKENNYYYFNDYEYDFRFNNNRLIYHYFYEIKESEGIVNPLDKPDYNYKVIFNNDVSNDITLWTNYRDLKMEYAFMGYKLMGVYLNDELLYSINLEAPTTNLYLLYEKLITPEEYMNKFKEKDYYTIIGDNYKYEYVNNEQILIYQDNELIFIYDLINDIKYRLYEGVLYKLDDFYPLINLKVLFNELTNDDFYFDGEDYYYQEKGIYLRISNYGLYLESPLISYNFNNYNFDNINLIDLKDYQVLTEYLEIYPIKENPRSLDYIAYNQYFDLKFIWEDNSILIRFDELENLMELNINILPSKTVLSLNINNRMEEMELNYYSNSEGNIIIYEELNEFDYLDHINEFKEFIPDNPNYYFEGWLYEGSLTTLELLKEESSHILYLSPSVKLNIKNTTELKDYLTSYTLYNESWDEYWDFKNLIYKDQDNTIYQYDSNGNVVLMSSNDYHYEIFGLDIQHENTYLEVWELLNDPSVIFLNYEGNEVNLMKDTEIVLTLIFEENDILIYNNYNGGWFTLLDLELEIIAPSSNFKADVYLDDEVVISLHGININDNYYLYNIILGLINRVDFDNKYFEEITFLNDEPFDIYEPLTYEDIDLKIVLGKLFLPEDIFNELLTKDYYVFGNESLYNMKVFNQNYIEVYYFWELKYIIDLENDLYYGVDTINEKLFLLELNPFFDFVSISQTKNSDYKKISESEFIYIGKTLKGVSEIRFNGIDNYFEVLTPWNSYGHLYLIDKEVTDKYDYSEFIIETDELIITPSASPIHITEVNHMMFDVDMYDINTYIYYDDLKVLFDEVTLTVTINESYVTLVNDSNEFIIPLKVFDYDNYGPVIYYYDIDEFDYLNEITDFKYPTINNLFEVIGWKECYEEELITLSYLKDNYSYSNIIYLEPVVSNDINILSIFMDNDFYLDDYYEESFFSYRSLSLEVYCYNSYSGGYSNFGFTFDENGEVISFILDLEPVELEQAVYYLSKIYLDKIPDLINFLTNIDDYLLEEYEINYLYYVKGDDFVEFNFNEHIEIKINNYSYWSDLFLKLM